MRSLRALIVAACCLIATSAGAWWQSIQQVGVVSAPTYQGLGDVSSGWRDYYSCAFVYSSAQASTSTSLCDLVALTGGAAVCTLRATASGTVDLSAYCPGSLTPSAACAAASGGGCSVTKAYNQISPGTEDAVTGGTLSQNPAITFSGLNSLPGMVCTVAGASRLLSTNITLAQPISYAAVAKTAGSAAAFIGSSSGTAPGLIDSGVANQWAISGGTSVTISATDNSYHAGQALLTASPNSAITVDGSASVTGNAGTGSYAASPISLCRANGTSLPGTVMEAAIAGGDKSANFGAINTNAHSRFAF